MHGFSINPREAIYTLSTAFGFWLNALQMGGICLGSKALDRLEFGKKKKSLLNCGITVAQAVTTSICQSHCWSQRRAAQRCRGN